MSKASEPDPSEPSSKKPDEEWFWDQNSDKVHIALTKSPLDSSAVINFVKSSDCGAVVYFGGTTRDTMDNKDVVQLSYEAYVPMALKTLARVANEALEKWSNKPHEHISKVAIVHRLGNVPVLEESVAIALSAGHRQQGWDAAQWILEQIKYSAEIWKSESYTDGTAVWRSNHEDSNAREEQLKKVSSVGRG